MCHVPGAKIDNNQVEQIIKLIIRYSYRKRPTKVSVRPRPPIEGRKSEEQ